jgi:SET domain-containing protein
MKDIEAGEMVIEYTGTIIRSILTDRREKYYESKVSSTTVFWFVCRAYIIEGVCRKLAATCFALMMMK